MLQWKDELESRLGLTFEIVDSGSAPEDVGWTRKETGISGDTESIEPSDQLLFEVATQRLGQPLTWSLPMMSMTFF